ELMPAVLHLLLERLLGRWQQAEEAVFQAFVMGEGGALRRQPVEQLGLAPCFLGHVGLPFCRFSSPRLHASGEHRANVHPRRLPHHRAWDRIGVCPTSISRCLTCRARRRSPTRRHTCVPRSPGTSARTPDRRSGCAPPRTSTSTRCPTSARSTTCDGFRI